MTGLADQIYQHSPVLMQQLLVSAYGAWWYQRRFGKIFHQVVNELDSHRHWTRQQFFQYQNTRLAIILEAARKSPYYSKIIPPIEIYSDFSGRSVLESLPLLEKETLRSDSRALLTTNILPKGVIIFNSSGTTGTPTDIYYTSLFHAWEMAVSEVYNLRWAGVNYRSRRVMFGVRKVCRFNQTHPPFWRYSPAENMAYASIYHLAPTYLPDYMSFLRKFQPEVIMGYPSSIQVLAQYILERKIHLPPVKAIFTTAETLTDQTRQNIERAFSTRIFDRYGAVENCMYASQCEYGRWHVIPEVGIIEILDKNGQPCPPGIPGEVVCTGLQNTLQPLIRYRIGDMACWAADQSCPCGRNFDILESIEGRVEDLCITADGREMLRFDTVFKGVRGINESQVIQNAVNSFTIKVIPNDEFSIETVEKIQHNLQFHLGSVSSTVEPVSEIPRSPSGKFRAVICNIPPEEKERIRRGIQ